MWANCVFILYYLLVECLEVWIFRWKYFKSPTNVIDMANILLFFVSMSYLYTAFLHPAEPVGVGSGVAQGVGYVPPSG